MLWAVRQLLVPCNYLRIRQGVRLWESKAVYDLILPAALTAATVGSCVWLAVPLRLYGHAAVTASLSNLLALLIAFYMAALAAVATFERKGIDDKLKGEAATLKVLNHGTGKRQIKELSYRQFISYLFGYLSFLSLILFIGLIFFDNAWPRIVDRIGTLAVWLPGVMTILDRVGFVAFLFGVWQMFVTSILGIYFLADRMQSLSDPHN